MNKIYLFSFLLAALADCPLGSSKATDQVELIDADEYVKLETVLAEVCKREIIIKIPTMHHKQISNFSTIKSLGFFFSSSLPYDHEFNKCAKRSLEVVNRLLAVIEQGNENVCGEEKLKLIQQFHQDYVSKVKKHVRRQRKLGVEIPRILKDFFINYATLVSDRCEQNAMSSLDEAKERYAKEMGSQTKEPELDGALERNLHQLVSVWNLIDALPWEKNEKFSRYLSGESPRVYMRVSRLDNLPMMQGICKRIRPLYEKTILPLMQLIYMGYYPTSANFKNALGSDRKLTSFFQFVQMCEDVLPIQFIQDHKLKGDEVELVPVSETADESKIIVTADLMDPVELKVDTSFEGVNDLLQLCGSMDLEQMVKVARSNINSRGGYMKSFLKKLYKFLKSKTKSRAHAKLIIPDSVGGSVAVPEEQAAAADEQAEEGILNELEIEEPSDPDRTTRVKRSNIVVDIVKASGQYIVSFLLYIIYLIYYAFLEFPLHFFAGKVKAVV